uniref:Amidase domain-containing protein n=1 Tax=Chromera velia CCMP2878 TaxID=1169474 RepID=A0A0G4IFD9_9ALVE|eukprot:Cvel_2465.t1-p1 / transcript=Cvel_2465.t1 / gene=Cvel_2465 / organism=Chromera_velia_CCMP2878 / gene_product=Fatty-acid amide hydrolase 1, putative / transcript_product=Fatty-acid amide hydrolase 1, putative / location=Cvel_scaffold97:2604-9963(+) / protein_length=693 / sequence_SO=supercontig / SO=protein_coding / is_pseudo=false
MMLDFLSADPNGLVTKLALASAAVGVVWGIRVMSRLLLMTPRVQRIKKEYLDRREKAIAEAKQKSYAAGVPKEVRNAIQKASVKEIVRQTTETKEWTAEQVMRVFCAAALEAHARTNCCTFFMFEDALQKAKKIDEEFAKTKKPKGSLHGVPFSVKDNVCVKGHPTTVGRVEWALDASPESAPVVTRLEKEGAIPFCKTSVPQSLLTFECNNRLSGRTVNPGEGKEGFSPGGSSGGESALIGAFGSPVGIGTDVGGSLRIPSHFCGLTTLKSSAGRVPREGTRPGSNVTAGQAAINSVNGFICRSAEDLSLMMAACCDKGLERTDSEGYGAPADDPGMAVPFVPWRADLVKSFSAASKKLRVGVVESNGFVEPLPCIKRAIRETSEALKRDGHEVIFLGPQWMKAEQREASLVYYDLMTADGGLGTWKTVEGEGCEAMVLPAMLGLRELPSWVHSSVVWLASLLDPWRAAGLNAMRPKSTGVFFEKVARQRALRRLFVKEFQKRKLDTILGLRELPSWVHSSVVWLASLLDPWRAAGLNAMRPKSTGVFFEKVARQRALRRLFVKEFQKRKLDTILYPAFGCPANPHNTFFAINFAASYTFAWNALDFAVGLLPATHVKTKVDCFADKKEEAEYVRKGEPGWLMRKALAGVFGKEGVKEKTQGLPVGVQLVCPPYCEEKVMGCLLQVEQALKK